jgi:hypothetical protein
MGKAIRATFLVLVLCCSAQAGYIPNGIEPPPSNVTQGTGNTTVDMVALALDVLALLPSIL